MTARDYSPFLRRLNPHCARALTEAASLCETRAHRDIEVEHWLIKLLELGEGDLLAILRRYELDVDAICMRLLAAIDRLPHDLRGRPGLSPARGPVAGGGMDARVALDSEVGAPGGAEIRSAHLLAALVRSAALAAGAGCLAAAQCLRRADRAADAGAGPEYRARRSGCPRSFHCQPNTPTVADRPDNPVLVPFHHRHHRQGPCRADRSGLRP